MNVWNIVHFGDLYQIPTRNGLSRPSKVRGTGYKMVNMGEMFAYPRLKNPEMEFVQVSENEKTTFGLRVGDLLFARQSLVLEGAGKCSIVLQCEENTVFESHLIRVRLDPQKCDPLFYFYFFRSELGLGTVQSIVNQVAAAGIRGSDLEKLKVACPPLPTQRKIAAILSAYDDLIENNARRIALLEKMAEEVYREWFVRLRFPGHARVPVYRGVPEGWEFKPLGEVCGFNERSLCSKNYQLTINYVDISSVSTKKIGQPEILSIEEAPGRARRVVKHGDIIWSSVRPANRAYCLILNPIPNLIVSTGFVVITVKQGMPYSYIYSVVTDDPFVEHLAGVAKGSAYPAVSKEDFEQAKVLIPSSELLKQFDLYCAPTLSQIWMLDRQNQKLQATRDMLLSRLLSGKLDVEHLDIRFPPAMSESEYNTTQIA